MNYYMAQAFTEELEKHAGPLMSSLWNSGMARAGIGAALGGAAGALTSNPEERKGGAIRGAVLGAMGGAAAPIVTQAGRQKFKEGLKRFYKAQIHSVTGKGSMPVSPGLSSAELALQQKAQQAGLTSIPGVVKGLASKPGSTLVNAWKGSGRLGQAFAVGDLALSAPGLMQNDPNRGLGEKTLGTIGTTGGYLLGGRMPILGSMLLATGAGAIGKRLGRGIDYLSGRRGAKPVSDEMASRPSIDYLSQQAQPMVGHLLGP